MSSALPHSPTRLGEINQQYHKQFRVEKTWMGTFAYGNAGKAKLLAYDLERLGQYGAVASLCVTAL